MKKIRGFRLGRRLVRRLWRWVRRPRAARRASYHRLSTAATPTPSPERTEAPPTMLAHLARCFTRRLCHGPRASSSSGGGGDGDDGCLSRLLRDEHGLSDEGKQRQQQQHAKPPPRGHLVVYVGRKGVDPLYRVPVPVVYFNHPLFGELLRRAEREFGFHQPGGITIPCPLSDFESVRTRVAADAGVTCRHRGHPAGH